MGTIPTYVHAIGVAADTMPFLVESILFMSASYCQLVQAQSPGMTGVEEGRQRCSEDASFCGCPEAVTQAGEEQ